MMKNHNSFFFIKHRYAPETGASVCHECEAGRSAPRAGTSCTCRPAGMCEDHDDFEVAKLDGSFRQLLGSNCIGSQADRCTKLHLSSSLLLQRRDEPSLFLEESRNTQFKSKNPARPSSAVFDLDCISTFRSITVSLQLFDSQIETETNGTLEIRLLDYGGVELAKFSHIGNSTLLNPDFNEKERWGCEDKGDSFPLNNPDENISATMDGTPFHYQNCVSEKKWKKIEARFDQCVRGVKKIEFRCVQNYCNVNWWQWVSALRGTVPEKPLAESGMALDQYQGW